MDGWRDYETVEYHQIYSKLIEAARHRGTVTYQELAHVVGLPLQGSHMGKRIGELLGAVSANEAQHGRPMLSAVAVSVSGDVGPGFFALAQELGLMQLGDDQDRFLAQQRQACYGLWQQKFYIKK